MKKLLVLIIIVLSAPIALMAQVLSEIPPEINPQVYFATIASFAAIILPVTALVNRMFTIEIRWLKQFLSWIVAIALGTIAWVFKWGLFETSWYYALIYSIAGALVANGIFNLDMIKKILQLLNLEKKKPVKQ